MQQSLSYPGQDRAKQNANHHVINMVIRVCSAAGRDRTGTGITTHGILSPGRLPVPPLRLATSTRHEHLALKWTLGDSNPGPTGYEPVALTN